MTDNSSSSVTVAPVAFEKTVYAVNDNTSATGAFGPGDQVTFQFITTGARPGGKVDNLTLTDFLPLPKFEASEVTTLTLVFVPDTALYQGVPFNPGEVVMVFDSDFYQPASGTDPNKETVNPVLSIDVASNSFTIDVGDIDPPEPAAASRIITYATVTATDAPAADGSAADKRGCSSGYRFPRQPYATRRYRSDHGQGTRRGYLQRGRGIRNDWTCPGGRHLFGAQCRQQFHRNR